VSTLVPTLIPLELLFEAATRDRPALSPDGHRIAYVGAHGGEVALWIAHSDDLTRARTVWDSSLGRLGEFAWSFDGRWLVFLADRSGRERWAVHAADVLTGSVRRLSPPAQARGIWLSEERPHTMATSLCLERPGRRDLYTIDLETGDSARSASDPGLHQWIVDQGLRPLAGLFLRPDASYALRRRLPDGGWRQVLDIPAEDAVDLAVVGVTDGGSVLLLTSLGADTRRLLCVELETATWTEVAGDPDYDISASSVGLDGVWLRPGTPALQAFAVEPDRLRHTFLDQGFERALLGTPGHSRGAPFVASRSHDDHRWLVGVAVDDRPVPYYLLDRHSGAVRLLFEHRPELSRFQLARTEPFSFRARDGTLLRGYLTAPPGATPPLPTVVVVHGGPWARETWRFNPEVQWLANRGYLTLQINHRGSTGYGKRFREAGNREWGGRMQDDLVDGVRWAIARRQADPTRLGIYGWSYGGYAALMAASDDQVQFACAIAASAPCDLLRFVEDTPAYWRSLRAVLVRQVGDPDQDRERLRVRSPIHRTARFRCPVLLVHGANDPRVDVATVRGLAAALQREGHPYELLLLADEGHGVRRPVNRLRWHAAAERFLADHLGGRTETRLPVAQSEKQTT
jgi:dipeptidyl aminopeptidase/acylaminoacyl peptidase